MYSPKLGENPNPWLLTPQRAPHQSSRQVWAHLLCTDCEQRLNRNGEKWMLANGMQRDGFFPLLRFLDSREPDERNNTTRVYRTATLPEVNHEQIGYFAASVFWRGSVHPWRLDGTPATPLGPYGEQFRLFLMGQASFPPKAFLIACVRETTQVSSLAHEPVGGKDQGFHLHRFPIPGFAFLLAVGNQVPEIFRHFCLMRGQNHPIVVTDRLEGNLFETAMEVAKQGVAASASRGKPISWDEI